MKQHDIDAIAADAMALHAALITAGAAKSHAGSWVAHAMPAIVTFEAGKPPRNPDQYEKWLESAREARESRNR